MQLRNDGSGWSIIKNVKFFDAPGDLTVSAAQNDQRDMHCLYWSEKSTWVTGGEDVKKFSSATEARHFTASNREMLAKS